jgi:hypothetical protein
VTDHYAVSDEHALSIARSIVANLNWTEGTKTFVSPALCSCVLVRLYVLWILATVRLGVIFWIVTSSMSSVALSSHETIYLLIDLRCTPSSDVITYTYSRAYTERGQLRGAAVPGLGDGQHHPRRHQEALRHPQGKPRE